MNETKNEEILLEPRWYHKKRYWLLIFVVFSLGYFIVMQIPSRLILSPETTGLADPKLNTNGQVDYFSELEKTYADRMVPPEDNGYRDLLAACGPRILEQNALMDAVAWADLPSDPNGRIYFDTFWIPLCKKLEIDPYTRPQYLDSLDVYSAAKKMDIESRTLPDGTIDPDLPELNLNDHLERLMDTPWSEEEFPEMAKWLEERGPVLDLFGECVQKPNFVCPRMPAPGDDMYAILLPDVQALRGFGRDLRVRIAFRINSGEIDAAWEDVMSMLHLSRRHLIKEPFFVTVMVGSAVERMALDAARMILESEKADAEQLARFAADLNSFPPALITEECFITEKNVVFSSLHRLAALPPGSREGYIASANQSANPEIVVLCMMLPIDPNIAGRKLSDIMEEAGFPKDGKTPLFENDTREARVELLEKRQGAYEKYSDLILNELRFSQLLSIRARSEIIACYIFAVNIWHNVDSFSDIAEMRMRLAKTAIAIERFKLANGKLPTDLAELLPEFLAELPLDYFSPTNESIIYSPIPDEETLYRLYSLGRNKVDDDGDETQGDDIVLNRRL